MEKKWELPGKRVKMKLTKHEIVVIKPISEHIMTLQEGEEKLRKVLNEAR